MNATSIERIHFDLTVHHLRFTVEAQTFVHLGRQSGAQIRGAFWQALLAFACTDPRHQTPAHREKCPMCRLVALETAESVRGVNPPRPFAIRPPLPARPGDDCHFSPGDVFTLGINLFGDAADLFPYVAQAMQRVGKLGIGYGRGRYSIRTIEAVHPFGNRSQLLYDGQGIVTCPKRMFDKDDIASHAAALSDQTMTLTFLTPTQLTRDGHISSKPAFDLLIGRLLERCQALECYYTTTPHDPSLWRENYLALTEAARRVEYFNNRTKWLEVRSGSRRSNTLTWISGVVGQITYRGSLKPFLEWLLWGQSLHVGKNAVKGNGWYRIEQDDLPAC